MHSSHLKLGGSATIANAHHNIVQTPCVCCYAGRESWNPTSTIHPDTCGHLQATIAALIQFLSTAVAPFKHLAHSCVAVLKTATPCMCVCACHLVTRPQSLLRLGGSRDNWWGWAGHLGVRLDSGSVCRVAHRCAWVNGVLAEREDTVVLEQADRLVDAFEDR